MGGDEQIDDGCGEPIDVGGKEQINVDCGEQIGDDGNEMMNDERPRDNHDSLLDNTDTLAALLGKVICSSEYIATLKG